MTDYRSLEQKVRDIVREQTNSQKRENVTNVGRPNTPAPETKVGRPDTAESPLSTKSTLAKTAEIQRKVIEGNQMMYSDKTFGLPSSVIDAARAIMVNEDNGAETLQHAQAKTVVGGKTKVIINPKTSDRSDDDTLDSGRKASTVKESILDGMTLVEGAKTHFNVGSKKLSLAKGDPVTFRHFKTGERVTGTFHSKTMIGGLPYVHVHLPDNTSMAVPPHQVIHNYDANEMPQPIKPVKEDVAEGKRIGPEWEKSSPEERKSTVKKEAKEISAKTGGEVKEQQIIDETPSQQRAMTIKAYNNGGSISKHTADVNAGLHPRHVHVVPTDSSHEKFAVHSVGSAVHSIKPGDHLSSSDLDDLGNSGHKVREIRESSDQLSDSELARLEQIAATLELTLESSNPFNVGDTVMHKHAVKGEKPFKVTNKQSDYIKLDRPISSVFPETALLHHSNFKKVNESLELDEAKRGRPAKNAGPAAPGDDEEHEHPIMQLRKAIVTNGNYQITHLNGQKTNVTPQLAQHALNIHNGLKTADQKQKLADAIHASHDSMKKALS